MNTTNRAAIESACKFVEEHIASRSCDSDGVSSCWRCNSVYLAKRMRELLDAPPAEPARPVALSTLTASLPYRVRGTWIDGRHFDEYFACTADRDDWLEAKGFENIVEFKCEDAK